MWPARSVINAIYAFLTEGATEQKDIDGLDDKLAAPVTLAGRAHERDMLAYAREVLRGDVSA